jgi:hypothetical protein
VHSKLRAVAAYENCTDGLAVVMVADTFATCTHLPACAVSVTLHSALLHCCAAAPCCCCPQANKVSCVGIISHAHGGGLVGSLSSSDLAGLLPEHFVSLADPVQHYLTARSSASWGGQQHPAAAAAAGPPVSPALQQQQQQQAVGSAHAWGLKVGGAVAAAGVSQRPSHHVPF